MLADQKEGVCGRRGRCGAEGRFFGKKSSTSFGSAQKRKLQDKIDELVATPPFYSVGGYGTEIHEMSEMAACNFGQCAISNQPSFHIPYIYSELGNIEKTAALVKRLATAFHPDAEGYPGDEDNDSMSAWYILSCLGFYQMCPSRPDLTVSLPLFEEMSITLAGGKTLRINKSKLNPSEMKTHVEYEDIMMGRSFEDMANR